jgi:hypothetical protein
MTSAEKQISLIRAEALRNIAVALDGVAGISALGLAVRLIITEHKTKINKVLDNHRTKEGYHV